MNSNLKICFKPQDLLQRILPWVFWIPAYSILLRDEVMAPLVKDEIIFWCLSSELFLGFLVGRPCYAWPVTDDLMIAGPHSRLLSLGMTQCSQAHCWLFFLGLLLRCTTISPFLGPWQMVLAGLSICHDLVKNWVSTKCKSINFIISFSIYDYA